MTPARHNGWHFLARNNFEQLIDLLQKAGYTVIGPVIRDGVIRLSPVTDASQMPAGVRDRQEAGTYALEAGDPDLSFEFVVGPDSPKQYLFPPAERLYQLHVEGQRFEIDDVAKPPPRYAFVGIRPCDLAALQRLDKVFGLDDARRMRCESDNTYEPSRREALIIVVNCATPGRNCFCASMGTGPEAREGFDLALTELKAGFVVRAGSQRGEQLLESLQVRVPTAAEMELADLKMKRAAEHMGRHLDPDGLKQILDHAVEHPAWDDVAKRCLSCGNCTMVCPDCFCSTVTETTEPGRNGTGRERHWGSCFTHQFSFTTSGPVRNTIRGRYRHWLRHKFCTWHDQFGSSGCVGCGRCITWCPVGIINVEELKRIQVPAEAGKEARR